MFQIFLSSSMYLHQTHRTTGNCAGPHPRSCARCGRAAPSRAHTPNTRETPSTEGKSLRHLTPRHCAAKLALPHWLSFEHAHGYGTFIENPYIPQVNTPNTPLPYSSVSLRSGTVGPNPGRSKIVLGNMYMDPSLRYGSSFDTHNPTKGPIAGKLLIHR